MLALPGWAALQERPCRGGGQQDEHRATEERLWDEGLFNQEKRASGGPHSSLLVPTGRSWRRCSQALLSTAWWEDKRQQAYLETGGVQTVYGETLSPCEDSKWQDRLSGEVLQTPSLEVLQTCLDKALMALPRVLDKSPPGAPASLKYPMAQ